MEKKDYIALTKTDREEILSGIVDEYGVRYSADGKKLITAPTRLSGEYIIKPGTESICEVAFQSAANLINIEMPSSIKYIGRCAFLHCRLLMFARLPLNLEYMGDMAFRGCRLTKVSIPTSLKNIPDWAFALNRELKTISLHDDIESIGSCAFYGCSGIEEFTFPPKVKIITQEVLCDCKNLKKITLPEGVTEIENRAFAETPIESVDIPNSVEIMDAYVFDDCWRFKGANIPEHVKIID